MLKKLSVENYALIDSLELELSDSLNIITGETGAGKSILLGALGLLLGNRADVAAQKDQGRNCVVEGVFAIGDYGLEGFFEENDLEYDPQTIVRRVISAGGKSRSYVNDLPVQQAILKELGSRLIDIHSQHQSLMLGDEGFRTGILDSVAAHRTLISDYRAVYEQMRAAERELEILRTAAEHSRKDQEWLEYQVGELRDAKLTLGEQEELEAEQSELSHAEDIKAALALAVSELDADETGILPRLKGVEHGMDCVAAYYPRGAELGGRFRSALIELRDIERELVAEAGRVESDPDRLAAINDRLAMLYTLQQKHRAASTEELIALRDSFEARLAAITGGGEAIETLCNEIGRLRAEAISMAAKITKGRKSAAAGLVDHVVSVLAGLGIPTAKLEVEITAAADLRPNGADSIRYLFSANKNAALAPVEKIASGGETSRLMLALKSLMARSAKLPTIIFDEIDTGVSGPIADAMGNIIEALAVTMQVVNITHLPQVASKGDTHFVVYKDNSGVASQTRLARLDDAGRVDEIAKMLSGSTVTDAARAQAKLLIGNM